jgi:hypothetical protein
MTLERFFVTRGSDIANLLALGYHPLTVRGLLGGADKIGLC